MEHRDSFTKIPLGGGRCPWGPGNLAHMLRQQRLNKPRKFCNQPHGSCMYNEVVLDSDVWTWALPRTVQGFFYPAGSATGEEMARDVRARFIADHGLRSEDVALFEFDAASKPTHPFTRVSGDEADASEIIASEDDSPADELAPLLAAANLEKKVDGRVPKKFGEPKAK